MLRARYVIGVTLLVAQAVMIGYARTTAARYFCWAPFDMQTDYELDVSVEGRKLSGKEIRQRYRRPAKGTDNRSVQNLIDIIEGVEARADRKAAVVMKYRINGKEEREWRKRTE